MQQEHLISTPKSNYLADCKFKIIILFSLVSILIFILLFLTGYRMYKYRENIYFHLHGNKRIIESTDLDKPYIKEAEVKNLVTTMVISALSYNFSNRDMRLKKYLSYFDKEGFDSLLNILNNNKLFKNVMDKKMIISAQPIEAPFISNTGTLLGRYYWIVRMRVQLRLSSAGTENAAISSGTVPQSESGIIEVLVWREAEAKAPYGVVINRIFYNKDS